MTQLDSPKSLPSPPEGHDETLCNVLSCSLAERSGQHGLLVELWAPAAPRFPSSLTASVSPPRSQHQSPMRRRNGFHCCDSLKSLYKLILGSAPTLQPLCSVFTLFFFYFFFFFFYFFFFFFFNLL
ncbi:uncharacterized protein V6R79_003734 [Siganus canaliculatus]